MTGAGFGRIIHAAAIGLALLLPAVSASLAEDLAPADLGVVMPPQAGDGQLFNQMRVPAQTWTADNMNPPVANAQLQPDLSQSQAGQLIGGNCKTPTGSCPIPPAPVDGICFCGVDAGFVFR